MSNVSKSAITKIQQHVDRFVTLSDGPKTPWEAYASTRIVSNTAERIVVEANLFPLVTNYVGHMTLSATMGTSFLANSPDAMKDIEILDESFLQLILGLPRWMPVASIKRAVAARDRLHQSLRSFYTALDVDHEGFGETSSYGSTYDVSELVKHYDRLWKGAGLPIHGRAAAGLSVPWA